MSIWGDIGGAFKSAGEAVGKGFEEGADYTGKGLNYAGEYGLPALLEGPQGVLWRIQLNKLKSEQADRVADYRRLNQQNTAWEDPLNTCAKWTSSLLHQSSDYVQGIGVAFQSVLADNNLNVARIRAVANASITSPLINLPLPGTIGGIPSALIPGVEGLKMITGLINSVADAATLPLQIQKVKDNIGIINNSIGQEQHVTAALNTMNHYLLHVANNVLMVFQQTMGLTDLPHFAAQTAQQLIDVDHKMEQAVNTITQAKDNAFIVMRSLINLLKEQKLTDTASPEQVNKLAAALFAIDSIAKGFQTEGNVRHFVENFLNGSLVTVGTLLHLPPVPDSIKEYLQETPSAHKQHSDINAPKYNPPGNLQFP